MRAPCNKHQVQPPDKLPTSQPQLTTVRAPGPSQPRPNGSLQPHHTSHDPRLPTRLSAHPTRSHPVPVPVQELCRMPSPMHQHPPGIDARPWSPLCLAFSTPSSVPSRHSVYAFISAPTSGRRLTGWARCPHWTKHSSGSKCVLLVIILPWAGRTPLT